jgi:hypothetical protein
MSSDEATYDTSDEDLRDALKGEASGSDEESHSDESNTESHEVRVSAMKRLEGHIHAIPLKVSADPYAYHTVSHFREQDFMPPGSTLEVENEYNEDEDDTHLNVYYRYKVEGYTIEVRAFDSGEEYYYGVRVIHDAARIVNSGHIYTTADVSAVCRHLKDGEFRQAMLILFAKYGGGAKDQQPRTPETLEWIVEECEVRTTVSGTDL